MKKTRICSIAKSIYSQEYTVKKFNMPRNVEIKAKVDDLEAVKARALELCGDGLKEKIVMSDTFFKTPNGRLKLRTSDQLKDGAPAELIFYDRSDEEGPKLSDYALASSHVPQDLSKVLDMALGIRGYLAKTRWLYIVGQTRVHCDRVDNLGDFMELEVMLTDDQTVEDGQAIADDLMSKLGVKKSNLLKGAYMDLLENNKDKPKSQNGQNNQLHNKFFWSGSWWKIELFIFENTEKKSFETENHNWIKITLFQV